MIFLDCWSIVSKVKNLLRHCLFRTTGIYLRTARVFIPHLWFIVAIPRFPRIASLSHSGANSFQCTREDREREEVLPSISGQPGWDRGGAVEILQAEWDLSPKPRVAMDHQGQLLLTKWDLRSLRLDVEKSQSSNLEAMIRIEAKYVFIFLFASTK